LAYVSKELTHFVAWNKETAEEQYEVLAKIMRMGWLTTNPDTPGSPKPIAFVPGRKISKNRFYDSRAICFCDIPVDDFGIHIAKYSPFGLAFGKKFLLQKGANPVFYIANDSLFGIAKTTAQPVTRGQYFDAACEGIYRRFTEGVRLLSAKTDLDPEVRRFLEHFQPIDAFCVHHILTYMKLFDVDQDDTAADNFYMEREWRTPMDVKFDLPDVCRIILPKEWEERFRTDFPTYTGPITNAPEGIQRVPRTVQPAHYPDEWGMTMVVKLARKDSGEKSTSETWFGPMGNPTSGVLVQKDEGEGSGEAELVPSEGPKKEGGLTQTEPEADLQEYGPLQIIVQEKRPTR